MSINVPASIGMPIEEIDTPCLLLELDPFERNVARMANFIKENGIRHRGHAKCHKSADIAAYLAEKGGTCGICCQKVSEAEAMVSGGVRDVLVSNEVTTPKKIERLAALATRARVLVCVDDLGNVDDLSAGAQKYGVTIECLVEIDVGAGRCGVKPGEAAVEIARKIDGAPGLKFAGLQAYQGKAQHVYDYPERKAMTDLAIAETANTVELLKAAGLHCDIVAGAGTGHLSSRGHQQRLQRAPMRLLYVHGRRLSARPRRGRQLHQRVREQPVHLHDGDEQDQGRQGNLRRRAEGAERRQRHARNLWPRRCQIHQVFGRARRDRRSGQRAEAQREAEADRLALRSHGQRLRLVRLRPERPCRGDLAGDGAWNEPLAA